MNRGSKSAVAIVITMILAVIAGAGDVPDYFTSVKMGDAPEAWVMNGVLWKSMTTNEKLCFIQGLQSGLLFAAGSLNELGHTGSAKDAEDLIKILNSTQLTNNQIVQQMDKIYADPANIRLPAFEVQKAAVFQMRASKESDKTHFLSLLRLKYPSK